jgi:PiT family inorganic phosphate transporter
VGYLENMLTALTIAALLFGFLNGFHDSANVVATVISSRAMPARTALLLTAAGEFVGPFLFGVAVAQTIGAGLIDTAAVTPGIVLGAAVAAIVWNVLTWLFGIPSSSSHALVGGLLGATAMAGGLGAIQIGGVQKALVALFVSPPLGLLAGFLIMRLTLRAVAHASPNVNTVFKRLQIVTAVGLAVSHGANDAQKTMGILTLGLVAAGALPAFAVPVWVVAASAGVMALGTAIGGWRLIRTLGGRIYKIRPIHGFTAQTASWAVILGAALVGGPVSTTQVVSSAIMGAGAAERLSKVRWGVAQEMLVAWGLTIPVTAGLAALAYLPLRTLAL